MAKKVLFIFLVLACSASLMISCANSSKGTEEKKNDNPQQVAEQATPPSTSQPQDTAATTDNYHVPPFLEDPDNTVLAATLDPAGVPPEAQAAYVVALKKPKLLAQLPCFCYCDRFGHGSLHDCFETTHAVTCDICLQEAVEADQMQDQGMTPQEIRSVIIAKYHPRS